MKTRKIFAVVLACMMIAGTTVTSFAYGERYDAEGNLWYDDNKAPYPTNDMVSSYDEIFELWGGEWENCIKDDLSNNSIYDDETKKFSDKYNVEYVYNPYGGSVDSDIYHQALETVGEGFDRYGIEVINKMTQYHPMHIRYDESDMTYDNQLNWVPTTASFSGGCFRFMRYYEDFRVVNAYVSATPNEDLTVEDVVRGFANTVFEYMEFSNGYQGFHTGMIPAWYLNAHDDALEGNPNGKADYESVNYLADAMVNGENNKPVAGTTQYAAEKYLYKMSLNSFGAEANITKTLAGRLGIK